MRVPRPRTMPSCSRHPRVSSAARTPRNYRCCNTWLFPSSSRLPPAATLPPESAPRSAAHPGGTAHVPSMRTEHAGCEGLWSLDAPRLSAACLRAPRAGGAGGSARRAAGARAYGHRADRSRAAGEPGRADRAAAHRGRGTSASGARSGRSARRRPPLVAHQLCTWNRRSARVDRLVAHAALSGLSVAPEGGDGKGVDAVAEGACALAEVKDHAGGEPLAEAVAQPAQVLCRVRARGGRCLDLDADHRAATTAGTSPRP